MLIMALPTVLLYELSILAVERVEKKRPADDVQPAGT
jgi:Sec-independent protein secretion pathway component TatC